MSEKSDEEVLALSDGEFYHYMLTQPAAVWAKWANHMGKFGLNVEQEACLGTWFANVYMAAIDLPDADYVAARLKSERQVPNLTTPRRE